jgi:hypothetical protein
MAQAIGVPHIAADCRELRSPVDAAPIGARVSTPDRHSSSASSRVASRDRMSLGVHEVSNLTVNRFA